MPFRSALLRSRAERRGTRCARLRRRAQARTDYWGVGIDYQLIGFRASGIPTHLSLLTVEGRLYPMAGAFFLAAGLAWQHATFRGQVVYPGDAQIPPIDTEVHGTVSVPVFKLGVGFMGRSGFVMGIDWHSACSWAAPR